MVIGLVVLVVVVVVGLGLLGARGRRAALRRRGPEAEVCVVCGQPLVPGDRLAAMLAGFVRERLGGEPDERAAITDPRGRRRYAAHVPCAEGLKEVCALCLAPLTEGDQVAGVDAAFVRRHRGAEPDRRSATTDPTGKPCFAAHARCAAPLGGELILPPSDHYDK